MRLTRKTGPTDTPVTVPEAKAWCRVSHSHEDSTMSGLVASATERFDLPDGILGRALVSQVWVADFAGWPDADIILPVEPVRSVVIKYIAPGGVVQDLPAEAYDLDIRFRRPAVLSWTRAMDFPVLSADSRLPVSVEMTCGYGPPADVPGQLKTAILLTVGHWWIHRAAIVTGANPAELPLGVDALIAPYRRHL